MSNSSLVSYTKRSPFHSGARTAKIDRISPHCIVGQCSIESLGSWMSQPSARCSCNYGIGVDGRIGLIVDECNRSWCTSSSANDQRAVTIECASDTTHPYAFKDVVYKQLIKLCVDICKRNGKTKLLWFADKNKSLNYAPKSNEMVITVHRWFANKACPGDWLYSRLGDLAAQVNAQLGAPSGGSSSASSPSTGEELSDGSGLPYMVRVKIDDLYIRSGPGGGYKAKGFIQPGAYTIVQEKKANGLMWGKLKSRVGWICLKYAEKI